MDIRDFAGIIILFIFADIIFYIVVMKGLLVKSITGQSPSDELRDRQYAAEATFILELRHVSSDSQQLTRRFVSSSAMSNLAEQSIDLTETMRQEVASLSLGHIRFAAPYDLTVGTVRRLEMKVNQNIVNTITKALNHACPAKVTALRIGAFLKITLLGEGFKIEPVDPVEQRLNAQGDHQWAWDVMPLKAGVQVLGLDIALSLAIANGEVKKAYTWSDGRVEVANDHYYSLKVFFKKRWKFILGASFMALFTTLYFYIV